MTTSDMSSRGVLKLSYPNTSKGIADALVFLKRRRAELIAYRDLMKSYTCSQATLESFIQRRCQLGGSYVVSTSNLRESYVQDCINNAPGVEVPHNFAPIFGRMMTAFIKCYPDLGIVRKYTNEGTSYSGIRLCPLSLPFDREPAPPTPCGNS